jgi:hypothetical protein
MLETLRPDEAYTVMTASITDDDLHCLSIYPDMVFVGKLFAKIVGAIYVFVHKGDLDMMVFQGEMYSQQPGWIFIKEEK